MRGDARLGVHHVVIAVGTEADLDRLTELVTPTATVADG